MIKKIINISILSVLPLATISAADLTVKVSGASIDKGEIGCALYSSAEGFPMDPAQAKQSWNTIKDGHSICHFKEVSPGIYALAVSHDVNGNRKTDTNFFGIPKEAWGTSNNIRPKLRAPTFDEAAFEMLDDTNIELAIEVSK